ncbi:putative class 3 lipase [Gigaspora margarita]|uniref:sn-1-specific diacylglycerol lipase n=1 Tax=Gigaspora margarita TaxID=4874 RepID=A0A8H3X1R2_GIGMA|nr:putative class 3 lipase [Gigaspora margarita]
MQSVKLDIKQKENEVYITSNGDSSSGTNIKYDKGVFHQKNESDNVEEQNKLRLKLETTSRHTAIDKVLSHVGEQIATNVDLLLSKNPFPDKILVKIKSLEFDQLRQPNPSAKKSIRLAIQSIIYHTTPSISLDEQLKKMFLIPFEYHSFVFDTMKIDIYDYGSFLNIKKKLGRAYIKLNNLKHSIINKKDFEGTFPLEIKEFPNIQEVGTIKINIKFHFPNEPPLTSPTNTRPPTIRVKSAPPILNDRDPITGTADTPLFLNDKNLTTEIDTPPILNNKDLITEIVDADAPTILNDSNPTIEITDAPRMLNDSNEISDAPTILNDNNEISDASTILNDNNEISDASTILNGSNELADVYVFDSNILMHPEVRSCGILDMVLCQETRDAIKEITVLYNTLFDHGWKLSKLEFLEAYMLLEKYYAQKPNPVTGNEIHDVDRMQKAQRYLKFSMASYGSFLFHWFGYGHHMAPLSVIRMNSDRKIVQDFFGLDKQDFICWEYGQNTVSVPNYMVIRDPETNSILVSIRGTMNIADVITDALAHYEPWNGGLVHRGVLRSAQYLVDRSLNDIKAAVIKFNAESIQVIGHSLGASISSIVTLLLREKCKDLILRGIDIRGWNFATAPCCSHELACSTEAMNYIYNFVNENDVIPRLSYGNLMDFKELVKFAANELKNDEYKKLKSSERLPKIFLSIDSFRTTLKSNPSSNQKLYIPGTIHYLYKGFSRSHTKSSLVCYTKDIVCEKSTPDLFTDIVLRRNWLFHHFPDRYDKKFKGVIKSLLKRNNEEEIDKVEHFWKKWSKMDEIDYASEEGGCRIEKWMSRRGHF